METIVPKLIEEYSEMKNLDKKEVYLLWSIGLSDKVRALALETGATLLLETAAELDETTVSLDWAASASASNSAKRSRGCAKDCTARRPAKHATK